MVVVVVVGGGGGGGGSFGVVVRGLILYNTVDYHQRHSQLYLF